MKKIVVYLLVCCNILLLFSCGVKSIFQNYDMTTDDEMVYETTGFSESVVAPKSIGSFYMSNDAMRKTSAANDVADLSDRKIIKKYDINAESRNIEETVDSLKQKISTCSGVIDESQMSNWNSKTNRYINMTVRIPKENTTNFLEFVNNDLNVTYFYESSEDITDSYDDSLLRLETYKNEESRLNELIKKATKVEDLVNIEDRLSNVRYQIQSITKKIANYDKKVDYTTFTIGISEVKVYTDVKETIPTKDRIIEKFKKNFEDTKLYIINLFIYIFVHIPAICLCLVIILIVLFIIILISKKCKNKIKSEKTNKKSKENLNKDFDKLNNELNKDVNEIKEKQNDDKYKEHYIDESEEIINKDIENE